MAYKTIYGVLFKNRLYNVENEDEYIIANWRNWFCDDVRVGYFLLCEYTSGIWILRMMKGNVVNERELSPTTPHFNKSIIIKKINSEFGTYITTQEILSKWK